MAVGPYELTMHHSLLQFLWGRVRYREQVPGSAIALRLRAESLRRHAARWRRLGLGEDDESGCALELAAEYEARADVLDPPLEQRSRFPFVPHPQTQAHTNDRT